MRVRLTPEGDGTVVELEHSPVPAEIIPNASPDSWGLGAGWELGMTSLGDHLAGRLPDSRAVDRIGTAGPEELSAIGRLAEDISAAWTKVLAAG